MEFFAIGCLLPLVQGDYRVCNHIVSITIKILSFTTKIVVIYFQISSNEGSGGPQRFRKVLACSYPKKPQKNPFLIYISGLLCH
jgi:hypothetical protein